MKARGAPGPAIWLGYAGLLPQAAAMAVLLSGNSEWHFTALALAYAYAALILSFLGGAWWGLAAQSVRTPATWVWIAAIAPSLIALATAIPWAIGEEWPRPSLGILGLSLLLSLGIDHRLRAAGLCPDWWMSLRAPLSIGLGLITLVITCI